MVTVNEKKWQPGIATGSLSCNKCRIQKIKSKRRLQPMGKINGEKSDCCLRNLRNTCTFEREREREREKEREAHFVLFLIKP